MSIMMLLSLIRAVADPESVAGEVGCRQASLAMATLNATENLQTMWQKLPVDSCRA